MNFTPSQPSDSYALQPDEIQDLKKWVEDHNGHWDTEFDEFAGDAARCIFLHDKDAVAFVNQYCIPRKIKIDDCRRQYGYAMVLFYLKR